MIDPKLAGVWQLVASASTHAELPPAADATSGHAAIAAWLGGFDASLLPSAQATSGLTMTIHPDGRFTELLTGQPAVCWFDAQGVLTDVVTPFDGLLLANESGVYVRPTSIPAWAVPVEGHHGACMLRYDDGDTLIADHLRLLDGLLIRTVNVVTDGLYLDRVIMQYQPAS